MIFSFLQLLVLFQSWQPNTVSPTMPSRLFVSRRSDSLNTSPPRMSGTRRGSTADHSLNRIHYMSRISGSDTAQYSMKPIRSTWSSDRLFSRLTAGLK